MKNNAIHVRILRFLTSAKNQFKHSLQSEKVDWLFMGLIIFILGIMTHEYIGFESSIWILIIAFWLLIFILFIFNYRQNIWMLFIAAFMFILGGVLTNYHDKPNRAIINENLFYAEVEAIVQSIKSKVKQGARLTLKLSAIKNKQINEKQHILLQLENTPKNLQIGSKIKYTGHVFVPNGAFIKGGFDYRNHLARRSISATSMLTKINDDINLQKVSIEPVYAIKNYFFKLKYKIGDALKQYIDSENHNLILTTLLGYETDRKASSFLTLRNLGLAHLLAISGLHMGLVTAIIFIFMRRILVVTNLVLKQISFAYMLNAKKIAAFCAILVGLFYLLLTGGSIPTLRAFIMACLMMSAILLDRKAISVRNLALAAWMILLLDPYSLFDVGFQLSFAATFAIILFVLRIQNHQNNKDATQQMTNRAMARIMHRLMIAFSIPIITGLVTMPISLYHFSYIQTGGFFANILIIPIFSMVFMPLAIITLLAMLFNLHGFAAQLLNWVSTFIYDICNYLMQFTYVEEYIAKLNPMLIIIILIIMFLLLYFRNKWRFMPILALLLLISQMNVYSVKPIFQIEKQTTNKIPNFMIKTSEKQYALSEVDGGKFVTNEWLKFVGVDPRNVNVAANKCDIEACLYAIKGKWRDYKLSVLKQMSGFLSACQNVDIIVMTNDEAPKICGHKIIIDRALTHKYYVGIYENKNGLLLIKT